MDQMQTSRTKIPIIHDGASPIMGQVESATEVKDAALVALEAQIAAKNPGSPSSATAAAQTYMNESERIDEMEAAPQETHDAVVAMQPAEKDRVDKITLMKLQYCVLAGCASASRNEPPELPREINHILS